MSRSTSVSRAALGRKYKAALPQLKARRIKRSIGRIRRYARSPRDGRDRTEAYPKATELAKQT